jgi:hypothetical protein
VGRRGPLREIRNTWTRTAWFIEGDISDCFGSFGHEILLGILAEKIYDQRFLHKLDEFAERELIPQYTRGDRRTPNPPYQAVKWRRGHRESCPQRPLQFPSPGHEACHRGRCNSTCYRVPTRSSTRFGQIRTITAPAPYTPGEVVVQTGGLAAGKHIMRVVQP